ncbi:hypothetical protein QFC21_002329 [Naganishia friedmannii]|uniref:Uncharacterized protein n=1 Tax=Naganishia friedmannii TaxID=89922 RepID=A0ACC2VX06_9TREE|nr:hypothetical protein QFC21_002329 [Naganishia friedmannii]
MERRSAAKRRHVYADLNSPDATSTVTSPTFSAFIPNPPQNDRTAHRSNEPPNPPVVNLSIPPAYQQPFHRAAVNLGSGSAGDRSQESRGRLVDHAVRNGRKWYRQLALGVSDALRIQSSLNLVSSDKELVSTGQHDLSAARSSTNADPHGHRPQAYQLDMPIINLRL